MASLLTDPWIVAGLALLGLAAGVMGGLLGVGGSILMIPGMTLLLGRHQHLYQAAAMIANVMVALPAALRHRRQGATVPQVLRWMLPAAVIMVLVGVALSNLPVFRGTTGGIWLGRMLAAFLLYEAIVHLRRLRRPPDQPEHARPPHITAPRSSLAGALMGTLGGLLGVGGGILATPVQQGLLRLPLRQAIANSSTVMVFSAAVGATLKNATLGQHEHHWWMGLVVAAILAPTCILGGYLGASLTHRLPLRQVRAAFVLFLLAAAYKMAAL